jgi:hypothetical protein
MVVEDLEEDLGDDLGLGWKNNSTTTKSSARNGFYTAAFGISAIGDIGLPICRVLFLLLRLRFLFSPYGRSEA